MKPKPNRKVIQAVNRLSGYVLEGAELTREMERHVIKTPNIFEITYEKDSEISAPVSVEEAEVMGDPTRFTEEQLLDFDKPALLKLATELGLLVDATNTADEIVTEILDFQNASA